MYKATGLEVFKITYHLGTQKKINYMYYKKMGFSGIKSYISNWLFQELGYPECTLRLFWIDEDNDEVDIVNEKDFLFYYGNYHLVSKLHLHVANVDDRKDETANVETTESASNSTSNQPKVPPADSSYEFAVHDHVECDGCLMAPIVGFRYKCIQCPNYDLCQNCESKHVHSEHMMVRMPNNNCPSVVETYITGRSAGRKHGKRSKTSCPIVKNGLSVILDDNSGENSNAGSSENPEQTTSSSGKERGHGRKHRRHHRNNFLAHLYEMMHDLAEGGGAAAAAYATGENASSSTKTTTSTSGENASSSTKTTTATSGPHTITAATTDNKSFESTENGAEIIAAQIAAQKAHEKAVKAAEIASKIAHETAVQAAKNITENMFAAPTAPSTAQTKNNEKENEVSKDKIDATTPPCESSNSIPVSPSLESIAQFLDPQYMRAGIQILNNFSDMFARMLDPMDTEEVGSNQSCSLNTNLRKNSTTSAKTSVSSNLNDMDGDAKEMEKENSIEKLQNSEETQKESKQPESDVSSNIEIEDIGSDSENDSISESFIKLDAPKEADATKSTSANISAQTTPPQSLNKSNVMDFAQLSADLKAHIAEEAAKNTSTFIETGVAATEQEVKSASTTAAAAVESGPVVVTTSVTTTTNEEKRAVPVYHADANINNAVHAMMAMGFSNEGAWLTQLLESVNGNISEALDLMSVAQRDGR